jgi:CysZ protein
MPSVPAFGPHSRFADFFLGLSLPFRAVGMIFRSGRLFLLSSVAALVTAVALGALIYLLALYTDDLVRRFILDPATWYGQVGFWLLVGVSFIVLLLVGLNTVPLVLLAPLQDPISEAAEEALGDFEPPPFELRAVARGTLVSLGHTAARVVTLLVGHALLLALNLLPVVGSVAWTVASILWTMLWLAFEYLDAPMARHLYPFGQVRRTVLSRLPLSLGFGAALYAVLWVPVLNLFLIPTAIVAGTLLYRGLRACGTLAPPTGAPAPAP